MIVRTKAVTYDARQFWGANPANPETAIAFDNWLNANQGACLFRYKDRSTLSIDTPSHGIGEVRPGDWVVAYEGGICPYPREQFETLFEVTS